MRSLVFIRRGRWSETEGRCKRTQATRYLVFSLVLPKDGVNHGLDLSFGFLLLDQVVGPLVELLVFLGVVHESIVACAGLVVKRKLPIPVVLFLCGGARCPISS